MDRISVLKPHRSVSGPIGPKATQSSHSCADFKQSDVRADFCADDGDGKAKKNFHLFGH